MIPNNRKLQKMQNNFQNIVHYINQSPMTVDELEKEIRLIDKNIKDLEEKTMQERESFEKKIAPIEQRIKQLSSMTDMDFVKKYGKSYMSFKQSSQREVRQQSQAISKEKAELAKLHQSFEQVHRSLLAEIEGLSQQKEVLSRLRATAVALEAQIYTATHRNSLPRQPATTLAQRPAQSALSSRYRNPSEAHLMMQIAAQYQRDPARLFDDLSRSPAAARSFFKQMHFSDNQVEQLSVMLDRYADDNRHHSLVVSRGAGQKASASRSQSGMFYLENDDQQPSFNSALQIRRGGNAFGYGFGGMMALSLFMKNNPQAREMMFNFMKENLHHLSHDLSTKNIRSSQVEELGTVEPVAFTSQTQTKASGQKSSATLFRVKDDARPSASSSSSSSNQSWTKKRT